MWQRWAARQKACILGVFLCATLLVQGCGTTAVPPEVSVQTQSLQALYPRALKIARDWKADAYLVRGQASFGIDGRDWYQYANFSFRSPQTDIIGLRIEYDPETDSFSDEWLSIAKVDPERYPRIEDSEWAIDSVEALEIAQAHGGADFLADRSDRDLNLYLRLKKQKRNANLSAVWFVAYYDETEPANLFVVVDALTGEVIETSISK